MTDDETVVKPLRSDRKTTLTPGALALHTYRIERLLNEGGMGEVYLARHAALGTRHAIKVIKPELLSNTMALELSQREAKVLRDIRNDAIVAYEGFLQDDAGRWYLCMEYVEGPSLAELLERGPLPVEQVYRLRDRLIAGLAAAHAKGVVHRDISPDNVILPEGRVENAKLIDFGIAKVTLPGAKTIIANAFAGKVRYASPEQLGLFGGQVDARSDIYSLGLVLAAAARGKPLPMGYSYETACQARQRAPDVSDAPAELQTQLKAMLQPDPKDRPRQLADLAQRWPAAGPRRAPAGFPGRRRAAFIIVGALLALAGGGYWLLRPPVTTPLVSGAPPLSAPEPQSPLPLAPPPDKSVGPAAGEPDLRAIAELPPAEIHAYAARLYEEGRLQEALVLWETAAPRYGPAALRLGELYDPVLQDQIRTPFSKPNPVQAEKWYRQAERLGVEAAAAQLQALQNWVSTRQEQP